jgi:hypothetical protein
MVLRLSCHSAIQVDHMNSPGSLLVPQPRSIHRIFIVEGFLFHPTLEQADTPTILQVDGRDDLDHFRSLLRSSRAT